MQKEDTIVVTGAAGFIGSVLTGILNQKGFEQLILVDDFTKEGKAQNLSDKNYLQKIDRAEFPNWLAEHHNEIQYIFHLGARTDTTEMDYAVHKELNLDYTIKLWELCSQHNIPLVYASSAATYGGGEHGYKDDHNIVDQLAPLNAYGISKNEFDKWALQQNNTPPFWAGLKFFNVYGPNEYHKKRMASVIFHAYHQIKEKGTVKLFRSHHPDYKDGEQIRDFVYVLDVVNVCLWLMEHQPESGLYNLGTGEARTFNDLVRAIFKALSLPEHIDYVDTPEDIRDKYQYFTEADMSKLLSKGYDQKFYSLEDGVADYVHHYLDKDAYI
ncbi:MAG: ADP-glyceromanno-heptose 6-epimerase [Flavipsychrobacter sp.]